ncbi:MAG: hypothetical protein M0R38_09785 [Bacteroidia bacterium]|nr:hypothetical protein [Bacteroidia bacterium]
MYNLNHTFFFALLALALYSCTSDSSTIPASTPIASNNPLIDDLPLVEDTTTQANSPLTYNQFPFGCPTLVNFVFSDEWRIIDRSGTRDMGFSIYHKALLDINKCLQQINTQAPIQHPKIKKAGYTKYFNDDNLICNNVASTDSIIVTLPNIGKFKSYYAFGSVHNEMDSTAAVEHCTEYGNLVLIDSVTNNAKVYNLYLMKQHEDNISLRLFYIDANAVINIMEVTCDTRTCHVTKRFKATIDNQGNISTE